MTGNPSETPVYGNPRKRYGQTEVLPPDQRAARRRTIIADYAAKCKEINDRFRWARQAPKQSFEAARATDDYVKLNQRVEDARIAVSEAEGVYSAAYDALSAWTAPFKQRIEEAGDPKKQKGELVQVRQDANAALRVIGCREIEC
jgi:hypothetical protein